MSGATRARSERGQVLVIFAIMLPVFLALGSLAIGVGNWYTHARHLQTKADAGALAGGNAWQFPCGTQIDTQIAAEARSYAGSRNPQVGGVANADVHSVLNGPEFYDPETNRTPAENLAICNTMRLDVKLTEDNTFPLASLLPIFPDIKRKAVVEIQEAESFGGLLPIAVRAPVPLSAAVFYNETNGNIHAVKYFIESDTVTGIPGGLQGWTTNNPEDSSTWANFTPSSRTGVMIAQSFRDACNTNLPNPNTNIPVSTGGPCFEDEHGTVNALCNQGSIPLVNCYWASGQHPNQVGQAGLQFIRTYADANPGVGPPALESSWLENVTCTAGAYYNWQRSPGSGGDCQVRMQLRVDVGTLQGDYGAPGPAGNGPLRATDIQVRFRLVRGDGTTQCAFNSAQCDLQSGGQGPNLTYATQGSNQSPHLVMRNNSTTNSVAISVQLKNAINSSDPDCRNTSGGFSNGCRWFYTNTQVTSNNITDTDIQNEPIQRGFRGNSRDHAGSIQWLRLTTDSDCNGAANFIDGEAASELGAGCFYMEMGLRGGIAQDADEPPLMFDDGTGRSQTGTLDCDPNVPQGQALRDSIEFGCGPWYARHGFDTVPLCPQQNSIFAQPNPGAPWDDWPPLTCVKTRPTGNPQQMEAGFERRFFGGSTNSCPSDAAGFVKGRNYWNVANNPLNAANPDPALRYGYKDDNPVRDTNFHPADPRIVTIFLVPPNTFTGSGQDTYPIAGFIQVYVTGYGNVQNGGNLTVEDPCAGPAPPQSELQCGPPASECGYIVWGHFINYVVPGGGADPDPAGTLCNPQGSVQPCVPVLVE